MKLERTCKCIKDYLVKSELVYSNDLQDKELEFHKERNIKLIASYCIIKYIKMVDGMIIHF